MTAASITARAHPIVFFKEHDAILNTLERDSNGMFLSKASFEGSLPEWDGIPLVFADEHPDFEAFTADPAMELQRINGRIVGTVSDVSIDSTGHPRLMGVLNINENEAGLEQLIMSGKLSLSTGFFCENDGRKLTGQVIPHHVLLFIEDAVDQPGDKGAFILNKDETAEAIGLVEKLKRLLSRKVTNMATDEHQHQDEPEDEEDVEEQDDEEAPAEDEAISEEEGDTEDEETTEQDGEDEPDEDIEELKNELLKLKGENATLKEQMATLKDSIAKFQAQEKDAKWNEFKNIVPPGLVENEAEARAAWEKDPHTFTLKALKHTAEQHDSAQEGAMYVPQRDADRPATSVGVYADGKWTGDQE